MKDDIDKEGHSIHNTMQYDNESQCEKTIISRCY